MVDSAIFWVFAVISVTAALGAVLNRSIIYAALCLIAVFLSIAGFFILNNADFLAIAQIIVYAVALTIIMLFAIMFTGDRPMQGGSGSRLSRVAAGITLLYVFGLLTYAALRAFPDAGAGPNPQLAEELATYGSTGKLGALLFSTYALPFELASILLLVAMIGAIIIAKKRFVESDTDLWGDVKLPVDTSSAVPEAAIEAMRAKRFSQSQERKLSPQTEIGGKPETSPETASVPSNETTGGQ